MSGSRHVRHTIVDSPVGPLTLVGDGTVLLGLYFDGHLRTPRLTDLGPRADRGFDAATRQLGEYFAGTRALAEAKPAGPPDRFRPDSGVLGSDFC